MSTNFVWWLSQAGFSLVHKNNLVYNTCWEDPELDRRALELNSDDRILVITSAGCNALDYALQGPAHVYAVDVNPRQNALLELKMAGIRTLTYDDFFGIFGRGHHPNFPELYERFLKSELSESARQHWDSHLNYFTGVPLRRSFYFRGTSGAFAKALNSYFDVARIREPLEASFEAKSVKEQADIYKGFVEPVIWNPTIRWLMTKNITMSMLGVPRPQREQIDKQYSGGLFQFIRDSVEAVFTKLPLHNNYFWWLYLKGHYSEDRCPSYLTRQGFEQLKAGLVDRISVHTKSITGFLNQNPESVSKFVLLDHMDWMSTYRLDALQAEWQAIVDRAASSARLIWRSAGFSSDFVDQLQVRLSGERVRVGEILRYKRELSNELHPRDRVHTYASFHIADLTQ